MASSDDKMPSLNDQCNEAKWRYEDCFNKWFRESFLKGKGDHNEACGEFFSAYRQCIEVSLQQKGLTIPEMTEDLLSHSTNNKQS